MWFFTKCPSPNIVYLGPQFFIKWPTIILKFYELPKVVAKEPQKLLLSPHHPHWLPFKKGSPIILSMHVVFTIEEYVLSAPSKHLAYTHTFLLQVHTLTLIELLVATAHTITDLPATSTMHHHQPPLSPWNIPPP